MAALRAQAWAFAFEGFRAQSGVNLCLAGGSVALLNPKLLGPKLNINC